MGIWDIVASQQWTTSYVGKPSKCNNLQGQEQGLGNKAKAKDLKIVLKDSGCCRRSQPASYRCGQESICASLWRSDEWKALEKSRDMTTVKFSSAA